MKKIKELYDDIMELTGEITKDHVGAYAAQTVIWYYPDYDRGSTLVCRKRCTCHEFRTELCV